MALTGGAADVAQRLYDGCADMARGRDGLVLPSSPLTLALCLVHDIMGAHGWDEDAYPPDTLGQAVAYVTERVRALLPDAWRSLALEPAADEILRHTARILAAGRYRV